MRKLSKGSANQLIGPKDHRGPRIRGAVNRTLKAIAAMVLIPAAVTFAMTQSSLASNFTHTTTEFNTDFVSAGVGGLRNIGNATGTDITVAGVGTGVVNRAILYWHGPSNSAPLNPGIAFLNGVQVNGTNLGLSDDNCWGFSNSQAFRADVTAIVAGDGAYTFATNTAAGSSSPINPNGASILVFFDDGDPNNNRDVAVFDGNDSNINNVFDAPGWNFTLTPITFTGGTANLQMHVADGQTFPDATVFVNGVAKLPAGAVFQGNTVPNRGGGPSNGALWDIRNVDVTPDLVAAGAPPQNLNITTGVASDCLAGIVMAVELPAGAAPPPPGGNNPPVADAGADATVKAGASTALDGTASFDPDAGDSIASFSWTETTAIPMGIIGANTSTPTVTAPVGSEGMTATLELEVEDTFGLTDTDSVDVSIVMNSPPVADAGSDQTKDEGVLVTLDGTASFDPDIGDTISYSWVQTVGPMVTLSDAASATPDFPAPPVGGPTALTFELTVTDDDFPSGANIKSDKDTVVINVASINDPPNCNLASADPDSLWPPNHKLEAVAIVGVSDPDSIYNMVTIEVTGITQDEPTDDLGDGAFSPDGFIIDGDPDDSVEVRRERSGLEDGRVYEIAFFAFDGFEGCNGSVTVGIPHDKRGTGPVDSGQSYDSTLP